MQRREADLGLAAEKAEMTESVSIEGIHALTADVDTDATEVTDLDPRIEMKDHAHVIEEKETEMDLALEETETEKVDMRKKEAIGMKEIDMIGMTETLKGLKQMMKILVKRS